MAESLKLGMFHYTGIASFLILLWIINSKNIKKGLDNSVLRFLGKISYGVYLMHWLLVVYVMEHWVQLISNFGNWYVGFGVLLTAVV
ncbi:MAG: acyltransferase family protein, partial [Saprospiraceae bacterium]